MKTIFKNVLKAIGIMCYFIILNFAYTRMNLDRLVGDIEVFSGVFLILGILALEKAYKKDNGEIAVTGIELLALSIHSLSIMHIITMFQYDFRLYLLTSSYIIAIYYVLKAIVVYTKERREYLKGLRDISEIVKEDEPIKKEAQKRNAEEKKEEEKKEEEEKKPTITKKKQTTKKKEPAKKTAKSTTATKKKTSTKSKVKEEKTPTKKKQSTTKSKKATTKKESTKSKTKVKEGKEND